MIVFEYGILKDGQHRLDYVEGCLYVADGSPDAEPMRDCGAAILGETHELSAEELAARDGLYTGYRRAERKTLGCKDVQIYLLERRKRRALVSGGLWLAPRTSGTVYVCRTAEGAVFRGSRREILEQLYTDQWTVEGRRRFKEEVARRIRTLARREVRTETVDLFFEDLQRARFVRLRRIWPRKTERSN